MPVEWALCIVASIFKGKGDIRNYSCYRAVKLLEYGMKVVEMVLKRLCRIVSVDEMQFSFMPERGTIDAVYLDKDARRVSRRRKKVVYVFCGSRESFSQSTDESVGLDNEEERNTDFFVLL